MNAFRPIFVLVVLAAVLSGACTGDGGGTDTPTGGATEAPPQTDGGAGTYTYSNVGILATLSMSGNTGDLEIRNRTGSELAAPGIYALNAEDGRRVNGRVIDSVAVANDETETFRVSFPPSFDAKDIGLVVLLIGKSDYGAFTPGDAS